ncbi:hypothetical protein Droror1_Dr00005476 [Drosera rotundifolia]
MKKLHHRRSGAVVHPSSSSHRQHHHDNDLAYLPAFILALTAALSPSDKELLAYLLSSSTTTTTNSPAPKQGDHSPCFGCKCFRCYMSYWVRWDESPNREIIHEIIDQFEEWISNGSRRGNGGKRERRRKGHVGSKSGPEMGKTVTTQLTVVANGGGGRGGEESGGGGGEEEEKGTVRKLVSFIGERIWGVWSKNNTSDNHFCAVV